MADDDSQWSMGGFQVHSQALREIFAECLGTLTFTAIGCSGNARFFLSPNQTAKIVSVPWIWGFALTASIYISGGVSGGHLNPAVTLGMASVGKIPWSKIPSYFSAQYLGAFLGAGLAYGAYFEPIEKKLEKDATLSFNMTMSIFIPAPEIMVSSTSLFADQVICNTFFLLILNAIIDDRNMGCPRGLRPLLIGVFSLTMIGLSFDYNIAAAVNPARDLSPRLLMWLIGWTPSLFNFDQIGLFWVQVIGCHTGGILGSWMYRLMIENHWPEDYDLPRVPEKYFFNGKPFGRVRPV